MPGAAPYDVPMRTECGPPGNDRTSSGWAAKSDMLGRSDDDAVDIVSVGERFLWLLIESGLPLSFGDARRPLSWNSSSPPATR